MKDDKNKREIVLRGLKCCATDPNEFGDCASTDCPYRKSIDCHKELLDDACELLKEQEPSEITKDEWQAWKKSKKRDPLCYMWVGDDTPIWALKPEDIHEPAYLSGRIVVFNGKPTEKQMEAVKCE